MSNNKTHTRPPFRLHMRENDTPAHTPAHPAAQWIFSSPHSGDFYPPDFIEAAQLSAHDLRRSEDAHIGDLLADIPSTGARVLTAVYPRAYLDLNRGPYELDPTMFKEPLPDYVNTSSAHARAGLGTIAKIVADHMPIYRDKLDFETAKKRVEEIYVPFHNALQAQLENGVKKHGEVYLLDIHSMPSNAVNKQANGKKPSIAGEIVIGDCQGTSCSDALSCGIQNFFTALGYTVARNSPYAGGFITRTYGNPSPKGHVQAVQIEIARNLYMDEQSYAPHEGFTTLRNQLTDLAHYLKQHESLFSRDKSRKAAE